MQIGFHRLQETPYLAETAKDQKSGIDSRWGYPGQGVAGVS